MSRQFSTNQILQDSVTAVGAGAPMNVAGLARLGLQVEIAGTAIVGFEGTIDGQTWRAVPLALADDPTTTDTTATATAAYRGSVAGLSLFRARVVSWSSGAVTVRALGTPAS